MDPDFYVRYYVGHRGKFGHEFLEFEFRPDGKVKACSCRDCWEFGTIQKLLLTYILLD